MRIGRITELKNKNGEAVRIATGSFVPIGADAVVMIGVLGSRKTLFRVNRAIRIHDNILSPGEDFSNENCFCQEAPGFVLSMSHYSQCSALEK